VRLIQRLRHDVLPAATAGTGLRAHVGGDTAALSDAAAAIMIMVFGGFIFGADRVIKEFGIGLSAARS
jgi:hypothetical protein